jgi:hypothetical protein
MSWPAGLHVRPHQGCCANNRTFTPAHKGAHQKPARLPNRRYSLPSVMKCSERACIKSTALKSTALGASGCCAMAHWCDFGALIPSLHSPAILTVALHCRHLSC